MVRKDRKKRIIMPSRNNTVLQSPETMGDGAFDGGEFDDVVVTGQDLRWKKWAVAIGAVALVWFLAIQEE
ncbi:MAG: hypothetical protein EGR14_05505 [Barnesiella intestinihominis]|nr:hypothetical protein [Barnesiella intestinihominis]